MARGRFLGRWRQFKLNHQHARLAQLTWSAPPPAVPATGRGAPGLMGRAPHGMFMEREELTARELLQFLEDLQSTHSRLVTRCARSQCTSGLEVVVLTDKSISFLVLQRVLQQALKTLKLNAATSDFSVINYRRSQVSHHLEGRQEIHRHDCASRMNQPKMAAATLVTARFTPHRPP